MLGHGTPYGLLAVDRNIGFIGYLIHDGHADLLKTKKTYSMWCHSEAYFERHGMNDTLEMEDLEEMKRIILERYNAADPITWFNRRNILIL